MALNLGVNVIEVDGRAAPAIERAPISVAGFLVRAERGVPDVPVPMTSFRDFVNTFGSYRDDAFGAHAVRGFFDNGGTQAYAVRVTGAGAAAAAATLDNAAGDATLRVAAGALGRQDPGAWGGALDVLAIDHPRGSSAVPAQVVGTLAEPFAIAAGDQLQVTVNGSAAAVTVTLQASDFATAGSASAAEVAAAINRRTTAFRAAVTPDQHLLLAGGAASFAGRLEIAGAAAAKLGFTGATADSDDGLPAGSTTIGVHSPAGFPPRAAVRLESAGHIVGDAPIAPALTAGEGITITADGGTPVTVTFDDGDFVNGIGAVTPGEVVALINRAARGFTAGLTGRGFLIIASDSYGTTSTIAVAAGGSASALGHLGLTNATAVAGTREQRELAGASETYKNVSLAAALTTAVPTVVARLQSVEFDLVIRRGGAEIERFTSLSMQDSLDYYAEAVINDPVLGSRQVVVDDLGLNAPGADVPVTTAAVKLAGGTDGATPTDTHYVGDPAARTGLYAFDPVRVQLLACPETTSQGVVAAALTYCEGRGDAMFVGATPRGYGLDGLVDYASAFRARKVYGALYAPWIEVANPLDGTGNNPRLMIPPVGHVLGTYARIGEARGVWKAPAGDEAILANALGTDLELTDADHTTLVKEGGVNGIRAVRGAGIVIDASRTLSTDSRWLYVGVRRLFNFVKSSLRDGLQWVAQEPNDAALRRRVEFNVIRPFLLGLWRQGAFGTDPAEQVFTVRCDATNNPPEQVQLGVFNVEVYFYPVKPAETIVIVVGQQDAGGSASEA